ncbi:MAG: hypothetical protein OEV20_07690, partial [Actinomycetota bacterium]|nr:hypothetical protein [Actinomycetota bacterium]
DYVVQGVAGTAGTAMVTASAPGFTDGTGTITVVQAGLSFFGLSDSRPVGSNNVFTVLTGVPNSAGTDLDSFQGISAANLPLDLTVTSSDGAVGQLSAGGITGDTVVIGLGAAEFQFSVTFVPLAAGTTTVSGSIPDFLTTTAATKTVTVEPPGITPFSRTIGAGLQFGSSAGLGTGDHGGITVRVESSNPSLALIAPDATTPGLSFIDLVVPDGSASVGYVVQAVAGSAGTATITASAPGFANGTGTITVVQAGLTFFGLSDSRPVGVNNAFTVLTGVPNGAGTGLSSFQGISAASLPLDLTVTSSDSAVGQLSAGGTTADTVVIGLGAGQFQFSVTFVPLAAGTTTVSGTIPGFLATTAATKTVTVTPPRILPFSRTVGAGLQASSSANLDTADHGGITVRVESSDPSIALIAPDGTTPGSAFIDVFVPDGSASVGYVVQGVAGTTGTATVTASAPGFANGTGTITVVEAALSFSGLSDTRPVGSDDAFTVFTGLPNSAGTGLSSFQGISAANLPLDLTVTSSDGAVGQLSAGGTTADTVAIGLGAGQFQFSVTFVPLAVGITTVSGTIPGFLSTTSATKVVTVTP